MERSGEAGGGSATVSSIATILRLICLSGVLINRSPVTGDARGGRGNEYPASFGNRKGSVACLVMTDSGRVVVAGAGLAGLRAAEELRERGFAGRITLIGAEPRPPYDRPPLSKKVLTESDLDPSLQADFAALGVDFRPDEAATVLGDALVTNRGTYPFDHLVLATGALPVALPGAGRQRFLRTYDDALALRKLLRPGLRLAIVGA